MRTLGGVFVVGALSACLDVNLPARTPLPPGSLRATLVTAFPNRAELAPAAGATLTLVGTSLSATADEDGNVTLMGITRRTGRVLVSLDVNGDGVADRSRLLALEAVGAGLGRDVNLGTLVLARNATVIGSVKRGDRQALASGHGGISVFLPQLPQLTTTGDDGSFVLGGVPEGSLVLNTFANGYAPEATPLEVPAGAELRVGTIVLEAAPGGPSVGSLRGRVEQLDGTPIAAVTVLAASGGTEARTETNAEGRFAFEVLPVGVYALGLSKQSFTSLRIPTALVTATTTDLGVLVLAAGSSTPIVLDGGPPVPDAGSAGGGSAGGAAGGSAGGAAGGSAGGAAGGSIMGPLPVAVVGPPVLVNPGRPARLSGASSQGDQPLSYAWTQVAGPPVVLSENNTPSADDPVFTAPAAGSVVEFSLVVTDRFGRSSTNLAIARVSVGSQPTARFLPDGGVLFGGAPTPLQSVSFDDGGLPLIGFTWALTPGSAATLTSDGGPTALLLPDPVAFGAPDELAEVTLEVTNSIGATSVPFSRVFAIRGANPTNWTLDAGPQGPVIDVSNASTVVTLSGTLQQSIAAPAPALSWSCSPPQTLLGATSLNASFVAPVVSGPDVLVTCSLAGTASLPLSPPSLTATAWLTLRDRVAPSVVRGLEEPTRLSPFGVSVEFDEDVVPRETFFNCGNGLAGYLEQEDPRVVIYRSNTGFFPEGSMCLASGGILADTVRDVSTAQNSRAITLKTNPVAQTVWEGPYLSTSTFADPRPVLASPGTFPRGQQRRFQVPLPRPPPTQLLVTDGTSLVPLSFDPFVSAPCGTPCSLAPQAPIPLSLPPGAPPRGQRTFWAGASMLVEVREDVFVERTPGGTWALAAPLPGWLLQAGTELKAVSQDGGVLNLWTRSETSSSFAFTESVAGGVPPLAQVVGNPTHLVGLTAATPRVLLRWDRGSPNWASQTLSVAPVDAGTLAYAQIGRGPPLYMVWFEAASGGYGTYRTGQPGNTFSGEPFARPQATSGFAAAGRGAVLYVASVEAGLLRLYQHPWNVTNVPTTFAGPPRAGFSSPFPEPLNVNLACEAAAPHLAFVEDSLVVTWQERCPPQTEWNVAVRVLR